MHHETAMASLLLPMSSSHAGDITTLVSSSNKNGRPVSQLSLTHCAGKCFSRVCATEAKQRNAHRLVDLEVQLGLGEAEGGDPSPLGGGPIIKAPQEVEGAALGAIHTRSCRSARAVPAYMHSAHQRLSLS